MFWIKRTMQLKNIHYFKLTSTVCIIPKHQSITYSKIYILCTKVSVGKFKNKSYQRICDFHTTSKLHIPPIWAIILRPILRFGALIAGRGVRRWWRRRSEEDKEIYRMFLRQNRDIFLGSLGILGLIFIFYYIMHIETDPITKRRRFIIFNEKEQAELGKLMFDKHMEEHKESLVSADHPAYKRLSKIIENILVRNKDLVPPNKRIWSLTIVDSPQKNAYVLPGRNIFFFLGALKIVDNDDQLTFILAHEMAHALLLHSIEQFSSTMLLDVLLTIPFLLLWAYFPDLLALILHLVLEYTVAILHSLPYSRALENEADDVGLKLAAKACADVREAVVFWGIMRTLSEMKLEVDPIPWLSSHPAHGDREQSLNKKIPQALNLMKSSGCPALSSRDPRKQFYERTLKDHEIYFKQKGVMQS